MSVTSLAESSALRMAANATPSVSVSNTTLLSQLTGFIPTETLAFYVAVAAALGDAKTPAGKPMCQGDWNGHWWWLAGLFVLTVALTFGLSYRKQKETAPKAQGTPTSFKVPYVEISAAAVAFLIWSLSLPGTPLRDFCGYQATAWSPVILLGGTIVVAAVLHITGKTVTWTKMLAE